MNNEQKQRALQMLRRFEQADPMTRQVDNAAVDMATLLQELVDAKEPEPSVPDDFYNAVTNLSVELEELIAETSGVYGLHQNGAPSPWEEILEGGRFERISSLHVVQILLATRQPSQPDDLARDAERYRWLTADHASAETRLDVNNIASSIQVRSYAATSAAIDAAIKRQGGKGE